MALICHEFFVHGCRRTLLEKKMSLITCTLLRNTVIDVKICGENSGFLSNTSEKKNKSIGKSTMLLKNEDAELKFCTKREGKLTDTKGFAS